MISTTKQPNNNMKQPINNYQDLLNVLDNLYNKLTKKTKKLSKVGNRIYKVSEFINDCGLQNEHGILLEKMNHILQRINLFRVAVDQQDVLERFPKANEPLLFANVKDFIKQIYNEEREHFFNNPSERWWLYTYMGFLNKYIDGWGDGDNESHQIDESNQIDSAKSGIITI